MFTWLEKFKSRTRLPIKRKLIEIEMIPEGHTGFDVSIILYLRYFIRVQGNNFLFQNDPIKAMAQMTEK